MYKDKYLPTPCYGLIPSEKIQFKDCDLFDMESWIYEVLTKIKLWYGTPKSGDSNLKEKILLGIQCVFTDTLTGKKTSTEPHCGEIAKDDIVIKELEIKQNDYINKLYINADMAVTYLKLVTKNGEVIEVGEENDENKKTVELNFNKEIIIVKNFFGYYNNYGIRSLGCLYITKKDKILMTLLGILRLRHLLKTNEEEKNKWENPEEIKKLNYKMQTVVKLCALPDKTFFSVIQFLSI